MKSGQGERSHRHADDVAAQGTLSLPSLSRSSSESVRTRLRYSSSSNSCKAIGRFMNSTTATLVTNRRQPQEDEKPALWYRCAATYQSRILAVCGGEMGIATDILNLRNNQLSSVTMLISALERFHDSPHDRALNRLFQVDEAADMVLTNVAAHAAEALVAQRPIGGRTQRVLSMRRKNRGFKSGPSTLQRHLFAVQSVS